MVSPAALLQQPAEEAPRRLALSFLAAAECARDRLADPGDKEALHDFRVAMRRLRSCMRSFRPQLGKAASGHVRRGLKALSASSGTSRDLEVQLAWVSAQLPSLNHRERIGTKWLIARLEMRRRDAAARFRAEVERTFPGLRRGLEKSLSTYCRIVRLDSTQPEPVFADALAGILPGLIDALGGKLALLCSADDQHAAHRARIAGKRLRYVLESVEGEVPGVANVVQELKELQNTLGDLHDAHVLAGELARALEDSAALATRRLSAAIVAGEHDSAALKREQRRDPQAGLLAIAERLSVRRNTVYASVESGWLGENGSGFINQHRAIAAAVGSSDAEDLYLTVSPRTIAPPIFVQSTFPTMPASTAAKVSRRVRDASREVT